MRQIAAPKEFGDALTPGVLEYACSRDAGLLEIYFLNKHLPFDDELLHKQKGDFCHIFYEPTIPGFRASTESDPITGIAFTVESRGFLGQRERILGDSMDIAKQVLPKIDRPLDISIRTNFEVTRKWLAEATRFHFPLGKHAIHVRRNPATRENMWAQDYIKSGHVQGRPQVLITRMAYEGKPANGKIFTPLLDSFEERGWVRSRLSWDGGDLQFSRDPRDRRRTLLFYGNTAKNYWGKGLSQGEYAWVLKVEFGADEAIDLSGLASHVDYFVSLLPDGSTALVSRPLRGNFEVSREVVDQLIARYGKLPLLAKLDRLYQNPSQMTGSDRQRTLELIEQAKVEHPGWPLYVDREAVERADRYRQRHCKDDLSECTSGAGLERMLANEPETLRGWVAFATEARMRELHPPAMLAILYSQLEETGRARVKRVDAKIAELQLLGFRVIEVPRITGDVEAGIPWAGISYVNSLVVDRKIFVPAFGLGEWEERFFVDLQKRLPPSYRVQPVFARYALLANGGVHCVAGLVREPSGPILDELTRTNDPPESPAQKSASPRSPTSVTLRD